MVAVFVRAGLGRLFSAFGRPACSRPAARRVLAAVAASCVLVAGLAPAAAGEDTSEGFVDADYLCSEGAEHYTDILRLAEPFDDVDDEQAAFEAVRCLFVLGIVWGKTATVFDPFADLSRSQLSALLARAWRGVGLECPQGEAPYVDVAANWAKDDIDCMWQLEVPVSGHVTAGIYDDAPQHAPGGQYVVLAPGGGDSAGGGNKFNPGGSVTNAQFALMAANAWHAAGFSCDHLDSVHFTDVDYSSQAGPAIYCLQQLGVLPLVAAATTLDPDTAINRADAVTLLARLWREDNPPPTPTTTAPQQLQQDPPSQDPAPTAPDAPAPRLIAGDAKIDATWSAPANNGSAIDDYDVQYRACTLSTDLTCSTPATATWGTWTSHTHTGTATTATITGLTNGTAHQVQVRASNSAGDSAWSASATATPNKPNSRPGAPGAPTLTVGNESLAASWRPPADDGGSPITGYRVKHRLGGFSISSQSSWTTTDWLDDDQRSHKISSLTNGKTYEVRVQARNALGESDWSNPTAGMPRTVPATPAAPTLVPSDQELTASWTAPDSGGHPITGYKVRHKATDDTDWTTSDPLGSSTKSQPITSLTNGTKYEVQVQAINNTGPGDWSDSAKGTPRTVPAKPAAPTLTAADQKLTASWTEPNNGGSKITGYKVRHRATGTPTWTTLSVGKSPLSREIGSLANGTEYEVQVQATNAAGDSSWSDPAKATPQTMPSKPSLTLTPADQKITASWAAPSDGGSEITGYKVRHRETSDTDANPNTWTTSSALSKATTTYDIGSLDNGTEYEVQVQATNAVNDSGWSDPAKATPRTVPSKPAAPTLTSGNAKLTASWTAPSNGGSEITSYKVRHRATGTPTWTTSSALGTSTLSYEITTLTNATPYDVEVQATNAAGDSEWSDSAKGIPRTVPSKPSPTLTPSDQKLTASWDAPSDGGSAITGYTIRHRQTDTDTWTTSSQTGRSYEISSLTNGIEYEVQVQATNAAGDSEWSDSVKAKPRTVPSKPSPTLGTADQKLTASWTAPSDGGSDITSYKVRHRQTGTSTWTTSSALGSSATSYEITGLTNGTEYEVQVQATNAAGDSEWSDSVKAKPRTMPSKPAAPTLASSDQKLTATWTAPPDGSSPITSYTIRHSVTDAGSWTTSSALGTSTLSYEITGLTNGTEYEVQVQATNNAGDSEWSDSAKAKPCTVPAKPAAPTLASSDQKLTASWTEPSGGGCDITGYTIRHRSSKGTWTTSSSQTGLSYEIGSLTNGTEYEVQVQATNPAGDSGYSDSAKAKPYTVPAKPSPTLTGSDQKLTATWNAPDNGGSDITGYKVRHRETSDTDPNPNTWTTSNSQTGLSYEIGSLTNSIEYEVQVQATNAAGDSGYSDSVKAKPCTAPAKPSPTLTPADRKLTVTWTAPDNGGCDITGYTIRHRSSKGTWTTSSSQTGLSYEIGSLFNGTRYEVQVQATNSAGDSGYSDSVSARPRTVPDKPSPTLTAAHEKITASWSAPATNGSKITSYKVRHRQKSTTNWTTSSALGKTTTSYEITGLTNGTEYEVQVQATNAAGDSGYSDSVKAKPRTVPSKPAAPTLTSDDASLEVTWSAPSDDGGSDITAYQVQHRQTGTTNWTTSSALGTSTLAYEITQLTNGTEYEVQVQATNAAGDSAWSDSSKAKPYTVPSKPSPTLTPADKKLTASWTAPSDGGDAITGYKVQYRATGTTEWTTSSALGSSTTSYEISPLNNGTEYQVQVQATNAAGDSGYSDSVKATPRTVPSKPAAPGLAAADQKLTATWTAPNNGGSAITSYKVRHRISDVTNSPWTTSSALGTSTLSYEITNLTNGVEYDVQVQATNIAGDSAWSDSSEATPPSLTASNLTDTAATLTLGGTISGNTTDSWWLKRTSPADTTCTSKGTTYTHSLSSLTPGDTYTYEAYSDSNCANSFADVTFTTLELTASKITDTTATLTLTGNSGSWYYKADKSPDNSCSSALSGSTTTKDLTGLSSDTAYNYEAYSNSTCTTKIATAAAFTTSDTTVHNVGKGHSGLNCRIGRLVSGVDNCLIGFTTGSNSGGYTMDSITTNMEYPGAFIGHPSGFKVSLHSPAANNAVTQTPIANATFSGGLPQSAGLHTWDCTGTGCQLSANTTYYIAMTVTSASNFQYYLWRSTSDLGNDQLPTSNGWSIADQYRIGFGSDAVNEGKYTLMIKVSATAN